MGTQGWLERLGKPTYTVSVYHSRLDISIERFYYMVKIQSSRKGCKDVFNAFLVENANYAGKEEIPIINPYSGTLPEKMVLFSKRHQIEKELSWLCFYEDDYKFEKIWRNPKLHLETFSKFKGIILPDFSLFRDMPYNVQVNNIYRSRAIGSWLQSLGISVIPNIRWGDARTYDIACLGVSKNNVIAVGSHGQMKDLDDKRHFINGLDYVVEKLRPITILVYGALPDDVFDWYRIQGINIVHYPSYTSLVYNQGGA